MSTVINPFIQEIEERKKREIAALNTFLDEKISQIQKKKEDSIAGIEEKYSNEAVVKSQRETARIKESARLEAKKIIFDAINANMETTFDMLNTELRNYTKKAEYKKTIGKMIEFAKKQLGNEIIIKCRKEDYDLVKALKMNVGAEISTMGGIIASDKEEKKEVDLTFEELMRTNDDKIKAILIEKFNK
jgi:V/A-type H+/Na+-transporting ATPase subunit E